MICGAGRIKTNLGFALALAAALLFGPLGRDSALAGHTTCKSDPRVYLSNGTVFDVKITIADSVTDVQSITYSLHGPAGTSVTDVDFSGLAFADKESVRYYADDPAFTYDSDFVVVTGVRAAVTNTTTLTSTRSPSRVIGSVSGYSGQKLGIHLYFKK